MKNHNVRHLIGHSTKHMAKKVVSSYSCAIGWIRPLHYYCTFLTCIVAMAIYLGHDKSARAPTIQEVKKKNGTDSAYECIERKFDELDNFTFGNGHSHYQDRLWGIASMSLYGGKKTRFVYDTLLKLPTGSSETIVCELGFMAGHSALLFLETLPLARVISFDLADNPWSYENANFMRETYGNRFSFIPGDSFLTVPHFRAENPDVFCDIILVDGAKEPEDYRYNDILNFRQLAKPGAILLLDEVNSLECVTGQVTPADPICHLSGPGYSACSIAYNRLVKEKALRVRECITTPTENDGFCVGYFV